MELTKHRISLDIHKQTTQAHLAVKKGDTARQIVASLSSCGVPYHIAEGCYAVFMGKKPDGNVLYNDCAIEGDRIVYSFTEQTASAAGTMICELRLYGADGNLITSPRIAIIVSGTVYNDSEVESSDEYSALSELVAETLALRKTFPQPLSINGKVYDGSKEVTILDAPLVVHVDSDDDDDGYGMDVSLDVIDSAYRTGRRLWCKLGGGVILPLVTTYGGGIEYGYTFSGVDGGSVWKINVGTDGIKVTSSPVAFITDLPAALPNPHPLNINGMVYDGSKEVKILDAPLIVNVGGGDNGYTADVSIDKIDVAHRAGRIMWCRVSNSVILPFVSKYGSDTGSEHGYIFSGVGGNAVWTVTVGTDGVKVDFSLVSFKTDIPTALPNPQPLTINGHTYDGSAAADIVTAALTVTVNPLDEGGYTCDKTMDELKAAHNAGRELYCVWGARLPMVGEYGTTSSDIWGYTFRGIVNGREYSVNIGTDGISVAYTKLVPDKLPSPEPLTINGQTYDGSRPVNVSTSTDFRLIEKRVLSEMTNLVRFSDMALSSFRVYLSVPQGGASASVGAAAYIGNKQVGYAWLASMISNGSSRVAMVEGKQQGGLVTYRNTTPANTTANTQIYSQSPACAEATGPFSRIEFAVGSGGEFPVGTEIQLWGTDE